MADCRGRAAAVRAGGRALPVRARFRLAHRDGYLRSRRIVHVGGGVDAFGRRPRARRFVLCRRIGTHQGDGRSYRRAGTATAIHAGAALAVGALCRALVGHLRNPAGNKRLSDRVCPQDPDSVFRAADGLARSLAGDPRGGVAIEGALMLAETLAVVMVIAVIAALMAGYPVALTLAGVSLIFAVLGNIFGVMGFAILGALPQRIFGVMTNEVLLAIPLFIFMGVVLERSRIAEDLLETMGRLFGPLRGGLGISAVIVGTLLAAAKGVVGATTVTMGLIMLPAMLRFGYDPRLAAGTVAATATLAQIFPPATVLVLLGDQLGNAYQAAQLAKGIFAPRSLTVSDLFAGALLPAFALVALYLVFLVAVAFIWPKASPALPPEPKPMQGSVLVRRLGEVLVAPLALFSAVFASILGGIATPTEAASIGAVGAILLAARKGPLATLLKPVCEKTAQIVSMIFVILIGATMFSLVFRALGGDDMVHRALSNLPGGAAGAVLAVMVAMFLLGFVMDAFEIIFVVVPIVAPTLLAMPGVDPVWLGIMMAVNLQTSYMPPPLGPTLFFLRGVAPPQITTRHIYVGIIPFVIIQLFALVLLWFVLGLPTASPVAPKGHCSRRTKNRFEQMTPPAASSDSPTAAEPMSLT